MCPTCPKFCKLFWRFPCHVFWNFHVASPEMLNKLPQSQLSPTKITKSITDQSSRFAASCICCPKTTVASHVGCKQTSVTTVWQPVIPHDWTDHRQTWRYQGIKLGRQMQNNADKLCWEVLWPRFSSYDTSNIPTKSGLISDFNPSQTNRGHESSQSNSEKYDENLHIFEASIQRQLADKCR